MWMRIIGGNQRAKNLSVIEKRKALASTTETITTTQQIKNLIGRMRKYNRAARAAGTLRTID